MKYAIVTGADGFIGHCLVKHLLSLGVEVFGIGINKDKILGLNCDKLHFIKAYFEDYINLPTLLPKLDYDAFFHFAWNGVFGNAFKNYELQLSNAKYCCDALMIAKQLNCKKFILASTINTLETRHYMSLDYFEPRYTNIYAMAKLSAEMMCKTLAYQNKIEFNCGLISMVYGENNYSMMIPNIVISNLLQNKESNLIDYNTKYDVIYVEDVANAFIAIADKGVNQKTYYIGHSNLSTFGEIFTKVKSLINPNGVLNFGVYKDTTIIDYSLIDIAALKNDTNFEPTYNFDKSILSTANWIKNNLLGRKQ